MQQTIVEVPDSLWVVAEKWAATLNLTPDELIDQIVAGELSQFNEDGTRIDDGFETKIKAKKDTDPLDPMELWELNKQVRMNPGDQ